MESGRTVAGSHSMPVLELEIPASCYDLGLRTLADSVLATYLEIIFGWQRCSEHELARLLPSLHFGMSWRLRINFARLKGKGILLKDAKVCCFNSFQNAPLCRSILLSYSDL